MNILQKIFKEHYEELYYRHKRVSLKDMYEKVMSRSRGKWAFT